MREERGALAQPSKGQQTSFEAASLHPHAEVTNGESEAGKGEPLPQLLYGIAGPESLVCTPPRSRL